ncbi:MAG: hypothetical protein Q7J27_05765 [Syntrophales bacterium]|nr:hypothetical protein [Syntrophales bacterium]
MEEFINYLSANPIALIVLAAVVLLMVFFIFKKLLKMVLISGLILAALCGYYYYKAPEEFPENVKKTISEVKDKTGKVVEKGKKLVKDLEGIVERVKKATSD